MSGATVVVAADGSGDFATLGAAVQAVARQPGARIFLRNGVYREKIFCDAAALTLQGESRDGVRLVWADAAAVGSLLHYQKTDVPALKNALRAAGVEVRRCDPL